MTQDQQRALAARLSREAQAEAKRVNARYTADVGYKIYTAGEDWFPVHKTKRGRIALVKSEADAMLFAGASDLLEALNDWMPGAEAMGWSTDKARAAIAKATGTPPPSDKGAETP